MATNNIEIQTFGLEEPVVFNGPELLGGKGAGLVWMVENGLNVPPGFTLTTNVWAQYSNAPKTTMTAIAKAIKPELAKLEKHFGFMPLLSVRSGARISMPGMMDTVLNVGIDTQTTALWQERLGSKAFNDSYARLQKMLAETVGGYTGQSATEQILQSIEAVLKSWDSPRAVAYRNLNGYDHKGGTAVTVQSMVFGNLNDNSCTGVLFTRNAATGESKITGEFIVGAQGEDIVAGTHTPKSLDFIGKFSVPVAVLLMAKATHMETLKKDALDIEFTVQNGLLYFLQVRSAKRTSGAQVKIAMDMAHEGLIDGKEAARRITPRALDELVSVRVDPTIAKTPSSKGLAASPGVVVGRPVFTSEEALAATEPVILITEETTPNDILGMNKAVGVITMKGGITSHAAVVARGMNKPCITGLGQNVSTFFKTKMVTMDGGTGEIWKANLPLVKGGNEVLVADVQEWIFSHAKARPIIFSAPETDMEEALLMLPLNALFASQVQWGPIKDLVIAASHRVKTLYVDLDFTTFQENNSEFINLFIPKKVAEETVRLAFHKLMSESMFPNAVVCLTPQAQPHHIRSLSTPDDLIRRKVVTTGFSKDKEGYLSQEAIAKIKEWRKGELEIMAIGQTSPEATKTFLTLPQALHHLQQ